MFNQNHKIMEEMKQQPTPAECKAETISHAMDSIQDLVPDSDDLDKIEGAMSYVYNSAQEYADMYVSSMKEEITKIKPYVVFFNYHENGKCVKKVSVIWSDQTPDQMEQFFKGEGCTNVKIQTKPEEK